MLLEALTLPLNAGTPSETYERIRETLVGSEFLGRPVCGYGLKELVDPSELFCAVQLALALDPSTSTHCLRNDYDIGAVYSYNEEIGGPFIQEDNLDLAKVLTMRNFWQRHFLNSLESTFHGTYAKLPEDHRPKLRKTHVEGEGGGACIHPIPDTLEQFQNRQSCADLDSHWDQVEIMTLDVEPAPNEMSWPPKFNTSIPQAAGDSAAAVDRRYFRGKQTAHGGTNESTNWVLGFVEPLPGAYGGFTGWARVCFAIWNYDSSGIWETDIDHQVQISKNASWQPFVPGFSTWVHGYESLMLPGGRIMLGRWVDMENTSGRGLFILWDV